MLEDHSNFIVPCEILLIFKPETTIGVIVTIGDAEGVGVGVIDGLEYGVTELTGVGDTEYFTPIIFIGNFIGLCMPDIKESCTKIMNATITSTEKAKRIVKDTILLDLYFFSMCEKIFFIYFV